MPCQGRRTRVEADQRLAAGTRVGESVAERQRAAWRPRVRAEVRAHVARQVRRLSDVGARDADGRGRPRWPECPRYISGQPDLRVTILLRVLRDFRGLRG